MENIQIGRHRGPPPICFGGVFELEGGVPVELDCNT